MTVFNHFRDGFDQKKEMKFFQKTLLLFVNKKSFKSTFLTTKFIQKANEFNEPRNVILDSVSSVVF
jgi:hypothetical protein